MSPKSKYKKKKNPPKKTPPKKDKTGKLLVLISLIYFVTVLGLILCVHKLSLDTERPLPEAWVYLLYFTYYVMPLVISVFFGLIFRPFWPNFRNLVVTIFLIHGVYSLGVYLLRLNTLSQWKEKLAEAQRVEIQVNHVTHKLFDEDGDGLVDRIIFNGDFDISLLTDGRYTLELFLSQRGWILPDGTVGTYKFVVDNKEKPKLISRSIQTTNQGQVEKYEYVARNVPEIMVAERGTLARSFSMNPNRFKQYYPRGPFDVNVVLKKDVYISDQMKKVIYYSRWPALLRMTSWEGFDPEIQDEVIDVSTLGAVDSFSLVPKRFKEQLVFFQAYLGDEGTDYDNNGLFDDLAVSMELYSNYEGPIYLSGFIDGAPNYQFHHAAELSKGFNKVKFILSGEGMYQLGFDGPYIIFDIVLTNNDPDCEGSDCHIGDQPFFTEYLDDYVTGYYGFEEFE